MSEIMYRQLCLLKLRLDRLILETDLNNEEQWGRGEFCSIFCFPDKAKFFQEIDVKVSDGVISDTRDKF